MAWLIARAVAALAVVMATVRPASAWRSWCAGDSVGDEGGVGGVEPAVFGVGVGGVGVAAAQGEAGFGFPGFGEAAGVVELVVGEGVAPVGEHAAAADGGELGGVADADEPPVVPVGEVDEPVEVVGGGHAGLVERRPSSRPASGRGPVSRWRVRNLAR